LIYSEIEQPRSHTATFAFEKASFSKTRHCVVHNCDCGENGLTYAARHAPARCGHPASMGLPILAQAMDC
jgi:hypothetical protein